MSGKWLQLDRRSALQGLSAAGVALGVGGIGGARAQGKAGLDGILAGAVADREVPFVVAMVGNAEGVTWAGAAGDSLPGVPAGPETMFRIFSMTKAIGTTAAMILVDRGKIDFDTPVEEIIPHFAELPALQGFDGDKPILGKPTTKATVRHLATHTSGLVYEFWNADMPRYLAATGRPGIVSGLRDALDYPILFEAGTRWDYGIGIDWLGQVVEAVDGRRIDKFCREELLDPLGMHDTIFEMDADRKARLADVGARTADGGFEPFELAPPAQPEVYGMGHCLYASAPDYMQFLRMFLNKGTLDGNRILSEAAVERMLLNHIGDVRMGKMTTVAPAITADVDLFPGIDKTHSFGFLRVESDVPGMRSAGSQGWAGVCNTHYWFDPTKDVAAVIMTQTLPFVEPAFMALYERFERAVYAA